MLSFVELIPGPLLVYHHLDPDMKYEDPNTL